MALEDRRRWFAAVLPDDDVGSKARRLTVPGQVVGHVVERHADARQLGLRAVRGEDALVDGREDRVPYAIAPREVPELTPRVARAPLASGRRDEQPADLARQMNLHGRGLGEHPEAEYIVGTRPCSEDQRSLAHHPACGEEPARARAEVETTGHAAKLPEVARGRVSDPSRTLDLRPLCAACHDPVVVRSRLLFATLASLAGCGEGHSVVRTPGVAPPDMVTVPRVAHGDAAPEGSGAGEPPLAASVLPAAASPGADAPLSSAPVGHLQGPNRLTHLFESLARLDDGHAHDDVHVLQYGDSHTASDLGVAVLRRALQGRFGDGGRGFVSIGKPWKSYAQDGIRGGMTKEFESTKVKFNKNKTFSGIDGCYGLLGIGIAASRAGARAWTDVLARSSHIELDYGQDPRGGSFDVFIDGARAGRVTTRAPLGGSGWFAFDVADAPHQVEVRAVGDGDVRVFGMTLDRPEAGVVVDALGINGAQIFTPLRWNEAHFAEQLRHASPDLVVVAYGTNEALEPGLMNTEYERKLVDFLGRIARAAPSSSCLLLGPPDLARHTKGEDDWRSLPRVAEIVAVQRRVADAAGCGFYDQQEAMGGAGSIVSWASEPESRAQRDRVHLTRSGYAQVATSFARDLMRAYDEWRAERGLPPTSAERTWGAASR